MMVTFPQDLHEAVQHIAAQVDPERYLDTLENLVRIPSLSGEEGDLAEWIRERLQQAGIQDVTVDKNNSLIASLGTGERRLLISAHMDTMKPHPEMKNPFQPRVLVEDGDKLLYGLGAASSKACLASIIEALTVLVASDAEIPTVTFTGVACDLHPTIHGIKELFKLHEIRADAALVGEPTNLRIGIGARGYAHIFVKFNGQPHHAGRPNQSLNPIVGAVEFIQKALDQSLPDHPVLESATLTPIEWDSEGQRPHTPQWASVLMDRRLVPTDPPIGELLLEIQEMAESCSKELGVEIELWRHQFPWEVNKEDAIVSALAESLRIVSGIQPEFYPLPFSSSSGFIKNIPKFVPVAFSGGDIAKIGLQEHTVISQNVTAAKAMAGAVLLFSAT